MSGKRTSGSSKSGSSGSCCLFLYFLGKIAVQEMSGRTPGSPRHPLPDIRGLLKKGHKHKEFGQKPLPDTPRPKNPWPRKFFVFVASFPFRIQEKGIHKECRGGRGSWGRQNSLRWISSRAFVGPESWLKWLLSEPKLLLISSGTLRRFARISRGRVNREVQTVNWGAGKKGAVETGVKSGLKKAHKPWIRGKKGAQTVN